MRFLVTIMLLACYACTQQSPSSVSDIEGAWMGALDVPPSLKLRVVFHFTASDNNISATMDSLDQNAGGIPVTTVTRHGSELVLDMPNIGGRFSGTLDAPSATISGTWWQGGNSFPLVLKRVKDPSLIKLVRPQEPKRPYPYREEDVSYENPPAGIMLAATLTIPSGKGPFPATLLITGSGPQDRDESIMGHKPFLVLADYLTRHGIAVLRADDRGIGKSGGDFGNATTADFATDAEAGIAYLKTRSEIDLRKIGLIGHSEGGIVAPMVAARDREVAFVVILAGTGLPGEEIVVNQVRTMNAASGMSAEKLAETTAYHRQIVELLKSEKNDAMFAQKVRQQMSGKLSEVEINMAIGRGTGPWGRYFIAYDPAPALRRIKCPVLVLIGEKDTQVSAAQNLPVMRSALEAGGNRDYEAIEVPGVNHLFQSAKTGAPAEYGQIEETISPTVLEKIASWITAHELHSRARR